MIASGHTFFLQAGRFDIHIDCQESPSLYPRLERRYGGFLSTLSTYENPFHIRILLPQSQTAKPENKAPIFTQNGLQYTPPGWEGMLDFSQKIGWMRPASPYIIEEIDYFLRIVCAVQAFQSGGLLFHAAGILREGLAYIFFGPSGIGKTTISRLSGKKNVLNDDLVLLFPDHPGWTVYSTPFYNPTQITPQGNRHAPLAGMYRLVQDQQADLKINSPGQALAEVVANVPVISTDSTRTLELLSRCQSLLEKVPVFRLHFRKDKSFWEIISQGSDKAGSPNNKNVSITSRTPS
jgi:hypothetical protein